MQYGKEPSGSRKTGNFLISWITAYYLGSTLYHIVSQIENGGINDRIKESLENEVYPIYFGVINQVYWVRKSTSAQKWFV